MDLMATTKNHLSSTLLPFTIQNLQKATSNSKSKLPHQQHPSPPHDQVTLDRTKQIHAHMIRTHFDHSRPILWSWLQSHSSPAAQLNFLITSYIKNNRPKDAIEIYAHMRNTDNILDNFTVPSVLKACSQLSSIQEGKEIHGFALKIGLDWDVFVHNSLMQMYSECASIDSARLIFDKMPERDVVSWSTMIRGYGQNRIFDEALDLIGEMHLLHVKPSEIAMINMVNVFAEIAVLEMARSMHAYVIKNKAVESVSISVNSALIDMYIKCGSIYLARRLFNGMPQRSVVSYTALIAGYIHNKNLEEGLKLFQEMHEENVLPNEITMLSLLIEFGFTGALELGKWLHAYMLKNGFDMSVVLATALIDMYGKCSATRCARSLFDSMEKRDIMLWTAMISGYAQANCLDQAFDLFLQMKIAKIKPNEVTMVNLLLLCAEAGVLDLGKWVHTCIDKQGIESDVVLSTALVDMYAKCGDIEGAYQVFAGALNRDICMWNAMIGGLAMHGHGKEALEVFSQMERARIRPNDITFIEVLHACSHAGLVAEGHLVFDRMVHKFGLIPKVEHYGCMVDLLGRAGLLDKAHQMINSMPIRPNTIVWGALLAACKTHKNLRLAELAASKLTELEPSNCGYKVLISNIYAGEKRWTDVANVRKDMNDKGIKKAPGFSSIVVNGSVHEFLMGDESHPQTKEIHKMLNEMGKKLKQAGYVANTSTVLFNIDEEEKETVLTYHSEKLAMAFGLISTAPYTPIRIVKNLRICDDCHSATKFFSVIYGRVFIVRDRNRFHRFSEGSCSCKDYW